ncbi:hypothetical protein IAT38_001569 [Cryptococcus sp. DSM 104549]
MSPPTSFLPLALHPGPAPALPTTCPSPSFKTRRHPILPLPQLLPSRQSISGSVPLPLPPTPHIPSLPLPPPLAPKRSAPSSAIIRPVRKVKLLTGEDGDVDGTGAGAEVGGMGTGGGGIVGDWSTCPNSVKDLRDIARSVGSVMSAISVGSAGDTTVRPAYGSYVAPGGPRIELEDGGSESTARPRFGYRERGCGGGFTRQMKDIEAELLARPADPAGSLSGSRGSTTVKGQELDLGEEPRPQWGVGRGIDEVEVEWCFFCGKEGGRDEMQLRSVNWDGANGKGEEEGDGASWQWVCKGGCSGNKGKSGVELTPVEG